MDSLEPYRTAFANAIDDADAAREVARVTGAWSAAWCAEDRVDEARAALVAARRALPALELNRLLTL